MSERSNDQIEIGAPHAKLKTRTKSTTQKPSMYKVYILNDDFTPMDFVIVILETVFNKSHEEAMRIMLHVHHKGSGLCGVYTYDVAETKASQVMQAARIAQHPLQCKIEKE
ncbi:MAG TPA: ATP-dependent Clp protease adapter ClpS [Rhodospirillaceae bacterium]|nr:ATP-dependent Clp protease adapter ClpS [Rhodospirillaceae bacterium]